eukprot:2286921-Prymnesium_polylepis.1
MSACTDQGPRTTTTYHGPRGGRRDPGSWVRSLTHIDIVRSEAVASRVSQNRTLLALSRPRGRL